MIGIGGGFLIASIVCIVVGLWICRDIWTPGAVDADMDREAMAAGMILTMMGCLLCAVADIFADNIFGEFGFYFSIFGACIGVVAIMKWAPPPTEHGGLA